MPNMLQRPTPGFDNRSFTLVELLVALAILAGGVLALLLARNEAQQTSRETRGLLTAIELAQQKLSEFEVFGFPDDDTGGGFPHHPGFAWQVRLQDVSFAVKAQITRVDLLVSYPRTRAGSRPLVITTCFSREVAQP
jgi:prepilin-type N-terminal cleavage/methylation domain-containing protein